MPERIVVEANVSAPVADVWRAYTTPDDITKWNFASPDWHCPRATVDLRPGGTFSSRMEAKDGSMGFDFEGKYTKIVENKRIEYTFGDRTAEVDFLPGKDGVLVRVTFDPETTFPVEQQMQGWQSILESFKRHIEGKRARS